MDKKGPTGNKDDDSERKRKSRGATTGIKAKRKNLGPNRIEFDDKGRPTGEWKVGFATDMGAIARNIKIIHNDWSKVPEGIKDSCWREAQTTWDIEDNEEKRKKVLGIIADRFRGFKTTLTTFFVYKTRKQRRKEPLADPLSLYQGITEDDWREFVRQRMSEKFQARSKKAQESQKHNLHVHYMGRAGYVGKKKQWYKEELAEATLNAEANVDLIAKEESVMIRLEDRGYLWIKAHTPLSKDPPLLTKKVIDEIVEKGEFVPSLKEDALVKATGKFDRPGRTRGVGSRVGHRVYFGVNNSRKSRGKFYTDDDLMLIQENFNKEAMARLNSVVQQQVSEALKNLQSTSSHELEIFKRTDASSSQVSNNNGHSLATKGPFIEPKDPFIELQAPVPCRLAVVHAIEKKVVVADGTVWPSVEGKMVHNTPLSKQNVHVSVDNIIDGEALLPVPWDGHLRVGEVQGSFAQWPKYLVFLGIDEENCIDKPNKKDNPKDPKKPVVKNSQAFDSTVIDEFLI